eukprot:6480260-Amphidinium_carterae.1
MADDDSAAKAPVCPSWDGNPASWRRWREDVRIWQLSCRRPTTGDTWPAGRMIAKLAGTARAVAMRIPIENLSAEPERPWHGVDTIIRLLEQELIPRQELRQTDALTRFYENEQGSRRSAQSIHAFNSYFLQEVEKLRDEGIKTDGMLLAWWYMKKAKLSHERKERLIGLLSARDGDVPSYDDLPAFMNMAARLFPDIHRTEQRSIHGSAHGQRSAPNKTEQPNNTKRHVHVAEHEDLQMQDGEASADANEDMSLVDDDVQSAASGVDMAAQLRAEA